MRKRTFLAAALTAALTGFLAMPAAQAAYPDREVKLVIPFAPGGATDVVFRVISERAEKELGQTIVPMNMGGAGGSKGSTFVKNQKADGYTILGGHEFIFTTRYTGMVNFGLEAFEPVCTLTTTPLTVTVNAKAPYNTAREMQQYVKTHPGKTVVTMTPGSMGYVFWKVTAKDWGVDLDKDFKTVIINGTGAQMKALLGGHVDTFASDYPTDREYVKDGRVKELVVAHTNRLEQIPNVPTFKELGWSNMTTVTRFILAPKGTPKAVVQKIAAAYRAACNDPEVVKKITDMGSIMTYRDVAQTKSYLADSDKVYKNYLANDKK
ncbi:MAG TPA: hypothetical protein DCW60_01225 [Sutterella sp.]|nr:hypothetical protein [Sutterella sp.]